MVKKKQSEGVWGARLVEAVFQIQINEDSMIQSTEQSKKSEKVMECTGFEPVEGLYPTGRARPRFMWKFTMGLPLRQTPIYCWKYGG